MNKNYTVLHLHTDFSSVTTNIDSVTKYNQYIDRAKELGMKSIAFSEHGNIFSWEKKMSYCKENGIKYIHGVEAYVTESLTNKIRDNYHICLYAKNTDGFYELNKLISDASNRDDGHYYFTPRITFEELLNTSDNIIITTACLGGILAKDNMNNNIKDKFINFLMNNKERCFLEIQHHLVDCQIDYNKYLYDLHKKTGIRLTIGTDTHALNKEHLQGRIKLQKAKNIFFSDEEGWDLSFKTYDELIEIYKKHDYINMSDIKEALENTNKVADMIEEYNIDYSTKYPKLYKNPEKVFKEKVLKGIKDKGIDKLHNFQQYKDRINEEFRVYKKLDAIDYMLLETKILEDAKQHGIQYGYGRGSVNGSIIAYLLGITECDSIKYNLNFFRFLNPDRSTMADIDIDFVKEDRAWVKDYLFKMESVYCADIITFNTIADKGAIRDMGRALEIPLKEINYICENLEDKEEEFRETYKELFKYVDIVKGTIVSAGVHASGTMVSPIPLDKNIGVCTLSTTDKPVTMIQMKEIDSLKFVKLDLLGLDNIGVINETCELVGIERLNPDNIDYNDDNVYNSIMNDTTTIFQMESTMAQDYLKQILNNTVFKKIKERYPQIKKFDLLKFTNGAIRPSGESFRDKASQGMCGNNGLKEIDDLLYDSLGYCLVQEQIMMFLCKFCGYSMAESDLVRRAIAKKGGTEQYIEEITQRFIQYTNKNFNLSKEKAEEIIIPFTKVIIDAQRYGFSENHNFPYSTTSYVSGYLRYYYPLEYLTSAFNMWSGDEEKTIRISNYCNKINIKIKSPKFRYSKGKYFMDKETNTIYKGIGSIKFLNKEIGDSLYLLKDNNYNDFIELIKEIQNIKINSKQLDILIKMNYFSEFGNPNQLLKQVEIFNQWNGRKTIKKDKLQELGLSEDDVRLYGNETEKQFNKLDYEELMKFLLSKVNIKTSVYQRLVYEHETCGYCFSKYPKFKNKALVLDVNLKYSPVITVYLLETGEEIKYKAYKRDYNKNIIEKYDLIELGDITKKQKTKKINDEWINIEGFNYWLKGWKKLN